MAVRGVAPGKYVTRTALSDGTTAGTGLLIGAEFVIPTVTVAADEDFVGIIGPEVVAHAKVSAQAWATQGAKIYFDAAQGLMTTTAGGNTYVGTVDRLAANPSAVGYIRLHGYPQ